MSDFALAESAFAPTRSARAASVAARANTIQRVFPFIVVISSLNSRSAMPAPFMGGLPRDTPLVALALLCAPLVLLLLLVVGGAVVAATAESCRGADLRRRRRSKFFAVTLVGRLARGFHQLGGDAAVGAGVVEL